jgi:hypothetical protein
MTTKKRSRRNAPIHPALKTTLGYDPSEGDSEVYADWRERKRRVCKPCWEIKYCPYGPLVEQSPLLPSIKADAIEHNQYLENCLRTGLVGTTEALSPERREDYSTWVRDDQILLRQAAFTLRQKRILEQASREKTGEEQIRAWIADGTLPPIHQYRVPFEAEAETPQEQDFSPEDWRALLSIVEEKRAYYRRALETGQEDNRVPLEPPRRALFERSLKHFNPDDYPDSIPETFLDASCNIFGHVCPVFFAAESVTETQEQRRIGRRKYDFATMMRVVRRDNYQCQHCGKHLRDDEVEIDHKIPVSKGGSSEEHNLRLTCFDCNRDKSDDYTP